jgi:hypothetical protein
MMAPRSFRQINPARALPVRVTPAGFTALGSVSTVYNSATIATSNPELSGAELPGFDQLKR